MWCAVVLVACSKPKFCVWTDSDERNGPKLNPEQPKVVLRPHRCTSEDSSACLGKRFFLPALCRFVVPGSLCWGLLNLTWKGFSPQSWVKNTEQTFLAAFTCSQLSQRYVPINQYGWQGRSYRINVARCNGLGTWLMRKKTDRDVTSKFSGGTAQKFHPNSASNNIKAMVGFVFTQCKFF